MYRIGHWGPDDATYDGLNQVALTDLYTCLESGVIGYKLVVQNMADKVFENKNVLEHLIKIYTTMFAQAVQKAKTSFGSEDFQNDAAYFLIARFLLLNILEKSDSEFVDDLAYLAVQHRSSLESLKSFEEISMISYDTLSEFLKTFGAAFYNGEPISLIDFENKWVSLYGDGTGLAIEFIPYLLHFLFAALHGAMLGGSNRIYRQDNIKKLIPRLYMAIVNILK